MTPRVFISETEKKQGSLTPESLKKALHYLETEGYLILPAAVDPIHLGYLNERFMADWETFKKDGKKWIAGGRIIGHYNSAPPTTTGCIFADVLANDIFYQITQACLRQDVINTSYACNTNVPGSTRQSFHSDDAPGRNDYLLINIPLIDVTKQNGSMEVVPGTHDTRFSHRALNEKMKHSVPVALETKCGDVILRFANLWHRGTSNRSTAPRCMLSMTHYVVTSPTLERTTPISLPLNAKALFESGPQRKQVKAFFSGDGKPATFGPNYFAPNFRGLTKELMFYLSPTLCEKAKLVAETISDRPVHKKAA